MPTKSPKDPPGYLRAGRQRGQRGLLLPGETPLLVTAGTAARVEEVPPPDLRRLPFR